MNVKNKKLIIYGESSFAQMIAHYFQSDSAYEVVAFCVDSAYKTKDTLDGLPIVTLETIEEHFSPKNHSIFSAIGYKSVRTHKVLFEKIAALSFPVASYISSQAMIDSTSTIGKNCLILPGVILEPYTTIEANCYLNSGVIVCHHSKVKTHSILAAGSLVGGYTTIGESSLIGFKATVAELLELADETLLGAGSLLLDNTKAHTMYVGTPAKAVRTHSDTGILIVPKNLKQKV